MAEPDLSAALAELAGHPYVLVSKRGDPAGTRLTGPLPAAEVLDLGFGAADALVEVHARGLAVDGLHARSLVLSATGEPRLAIDALRLDDPADRADDVSALRRALAGLLPDDDDPTTRATRTVLDDDTVPTAAALRDALAAVRLGRPPARPPMPSTAGPVRPTGAAGERVGEAVDPAQRLRGRPHADGGPPTPATSGTRSPRRPVSVPVVVLVVLVVLVGLLWLLTR